MPKPVGAIKTRNSQISFNTIPADENKPKAFAELVTLPDDSDATLIDG
jgi:hypothetical protein